MRLNLLLLLTITNLKLSYSQIYNAITLKTKILSPIGLALEVPVMNKFTAEIGVSYFGINYLMAGGSENIHIYWSSLKYHINLDNKSSFYFYTGVKHKIHSNLDNPKPNVTTRGNLNIYRLPLGMGIKNRRVEFWTGIDLNIYTIKNELNRYTYSLSAPSSTEIWKPASMALSIGLNINLVNFYTRKNAKNTSN